MSLGFGETDILPEIMPDAASRNVRGKQRSTDSTYTESIPDLRLEGVDYVSHGGWKLVLEAARVHFKRGNPSSSSIGAANMKLQSEGTSKDTAEDTAEDETVAKDEAIAKEETIEHENSITTLRNVAITLELVQERTEMETDSYPGSQMQYAKRRNQRDDDQHLLFYIVIRYHDIVILLIVIND
jgi:hypothetical protein